MCLKLNPKACLAKKSKQHGSMLVIALFVIIVFALLGLTMTRLLSSSSETIAYEVLGQRALNAARSGLECAVATQFEGGCTMPPTNGIFSGVAGLENCSYTVDAPVAKAINNNTYDYYTFSSTGQCTAGDISVTRTVFIDAILETP
jgi:MSHA biogenesis protein MshP